MRNLSAAKMVACLTVGICLHLPANAQRAISIGVDQDTETPSVPSRVVGPVDDARVVRLIGNTHPQALREFDKGRVDPGKLLDRIVLVLKRSPQQEAALSAFNARQYDPKSPDFHHWLGAEEFGRLYGPSDADIAAIASWLQNHGFRIDLVSKGRVTIQFTGTVAQVEEAFHVEMHNYLIDGKMHIANDRDPSIPDALFPVVTGIASLHDFFPEHFSHPGNYVKRDLKTGKYTVIEPDSPYLGGTLGSVLGSGLNQTGSLSGKSSPGGVQPEFGYVDGSTGYQREELSPYDVATIYNILPLWNAATPINGKGVNVAIVALSDVVTSDFNTYRSTFGLPAGTLTTLHSGADPGITNSQGENTEDTEMVSATAPGANVVLVADANTPTTSGLATAITYIIDNSIAPILTMSYGACELKLGTGGNSAWNQLFQQAATAGISSFVAAGDSGSAVCTSQDGTPPYGDTYGLAVSGMASTPFVTAVGGTDLQWPFVEGTKPVSTYWNSTNDAHGASAKGYMPEMSWNDTCTNPLLLNVYTAYTNNEALCNAAINGNPGLVEMAAGSGGVSNCTQNSTTGSSTTFDPTSCEKGYDKPAWQTGVAGIPADGHRDLPDVSMFAAYGFQQSTGIPGSALLICQASASPEKSCDYANPNYIIYQENGGTSAASPMTAGIMALVLQKVGSAQGLANPVFYSLAAKENYAACNSNTVKPGNSCIFYDTTTGSNAAVCVTGDYECITNTSGDTAGILGGYAATSGYDVSTGLGTFNVTNLVNAWPTTATAPAITLTPASVAFPATAVGKTSAAMNVTVKNTGTAAATLTSETTAAPFLKSATTCGASLAAGASCTVSVEFKPTSAVASTGTLSIADNAAGSPQTVNLSGTGTSAQTFTVSVTPASLAFGSLAVGTTSAAKLVTMKNTGTGAVTLTSETTAAPFVKSATTCGASLAAGASCTVSVEFKPTAATISSGTLSIVDNATGSPQTVSLSGTGTSAQTLTVSVTPASLAFGSLAVGTTSAAKLVTVKNTGTGAVTLTSETAAAPFVKSATTCGASLAAGASCTVSVEFKPTAAVASSGALSIADNASGSPQAVTLSGTGTAAAGLTFTPNAIAFPAQIVGSTSDAQVIAVKNTGAAAVTITSIALGGTNATSFEELGTCGASLAASASCSIYVAFKPAAAGALSGTLTFTDSATGSPQKVNLTGTGTAKPVVKLSVASLAFGTVKTGTASPAKVVTVTNSGTATLNITGISLTGASPASFEQLSTCTSTLAGGANCSVYVAFKPKAVGAVSASLTIADDGSTATQTVTLTGTGN